jgi:hypothetical protein
MDIEQGEGWVKKMHLVMKYLIVRSRSAQFQISLLGEGDDSVGLVCERERAELQRWQAP